jgi:hypothetical protein
VHQARFADARRTEEREELARFVGSRLLEGRLEQPALSLATNERRIEALLVTSRARSDGK